LSEERTLGAFSRAHCWVLCCLDPNLGDQYIDRDGRHGDVIRPGHEPPWQGIRAVCQAQHRPSVYHMCRCCVALTEEVAQTGGRPSSSMGGSGMMKGTRSTAFGLEETEADYSQASTPPRSDLLITPDCALAFCIASTSFLPLPSSSRLTSQDIFRVVVADRFAELALPDTGSHRHPPPCTPASTAKVYPRALSLHLAGQGSLPDEQQEWGAATRQRCIWANAWHICGLLWADAWHKPGARQPADKPKHGSSRYEKGAHE